MQWMASIPLWTLCLTIFVLRVCDVTLGTVRTVAIVKGHVSMVVILGFFELMIWVVAISQVVLRLEESWFLAFAYAGGFAAGNAVGIVVGRKLAMGTSAIRFLSSKLGGSLAEALLDEGYKFTTFSGQGSNGPVKLVYAVAPRKFVRQMIRSARVHDPDVFWISEPAPRAAAERAWGCVRHCS